MPPTDGQTLCVSIHDVAPLTWPDCLRLHEAIRAVADIPVTFLVVPRYHGVETRAPAYEKALGRLLMQGHELALHGYTHLDAEPVTGGLHQRFLRRVYTQGEGEFAAVDAARARRLIELGLAWFRQRNWPVSGFVAPAWLLGEDAWQALREFAFAYTTTFRYFHLLPQGQSLLSPSLVYATRNALGRSLSRRWAGMSSARLAAAPLVRLSLHPRDARHPEIVRHFQQMIAALLAYRQAGTKASFAHRYALDRASALTASSTGPSMARGTAPSRDDTVGSTRIY